MYVKTLTSLFSATSHERQKYEQARSTQEHNCITLVGTLALCAIVEKVKQLKTNFLKAQKNKAIDSIAAGCEV